MSEIGMTRTELESILRMERLTLTQNLLYHRRCIRETAAAIEQAERRLEEINDAEGLLASATAGELPVVAYALDSRRVETIHAVGDVL